MTVGGHTLRGAWQDERRLLTKVPRPFDGFIEHAERVSPTCLITFERTRYSVPASYANWPVSLRMYGDRLVVAAEGKLNHPEGQACQRTRSFSNEAGAFSPMDQLYTSWSTWTSKKRAGEKAMVRRACTAGVLAALLVLAGCASGYKEFYKSAPGITPENMAQMRLAPPPAMPIVDRAQPGDPKTILDAYASHGYIMIGNSVFNSGRNESDDAAIRQAQAVGADLVLILNPKYTGSVTSSIPLTTPTTTTSYTNASATAYTPRGQVTAHGTGTTTTYGSTTTYIPLTINRADYGAVYFIKQRFGLGAFARDLTDAERQELQSNKGVVIRVVVDGTPAFDADLLVGDMVLAIDGLTVANGPAFSEMLRARRGRLISITLVRKGTKIEKSIQLNP